MRGLVFGLWMTALGGALLAGCVPAGGGGGGGGSGGTPDEQDGARPDAAACVPDCGDRLCGDDGCGAPCGVCDDDAVCSIDGICVDVTATCGDDTCADGEDCATCPADCGPCCGNGTCDPTQAESCATCLADCPCPDGETCAVEARRCVPGETPDAGPPPDGGPPRDATLPDATRPDAGPGGPPRILTLNANRRTLTEGQQLVLSAVVTDPDGIADLIGGVLESPAGASYGAFVTSGEEGAYALTLTWADLGAVEAIDFDQGDEEVRPLEAVFFDQSGASARQVIEVTLTCAGFGACDGTCTDLSTPTDCGRCGNACRAEGMICDVDICRCPAGADVCDGACTDLSTPTDCGRCGNACAPLFECAAGSCACVGDCLRPRRGELAIVEFMPDPAAVNDTEGEWFEVVNLADRPISLDGVAIGDPAAIVGGADRDVLRLGVDAPLIPEGGRLVFARQADPDLNGGVDVDVPFPTLSLRNDTDVIAIVAPDGADVFRLQYILPPDDLPGASWQYGGGVRDAEAIARFPIGWCQARAPWPGSAGDLGSPGAIEPMCR